MIDRKEVHEDIDVLKGFYVRFLGIMIIILLGYPLLSFERLELQRRHQLGSVQARFKNSIPEKQKRVNI